jgi:hypothetical protein
MSKNRESRYSKSKISGRTLDLSVRNLNLPKICPPQMKGDIEEIQEALPKTLQ